MTVTDRKEEKDQKEEPVREQEAPAPSPVITPAPILTPVHRGNHPSFFHRRDRTADQFIREYMENDSYSEEQKDFLIRCLEQGDTVEFIRKYARPNLSVERMLWLRDLVGRRMIYGQ